MSAPARAFRWLISYHVAIDTLAREFAALHAAETGTQLDRDAYPELTTDDWQAVARRLAAVAPHPTLGELRAARTFLAARAEK